MVKKLVSIWVEAEKIEKIKENYKETVSEFIRKAIDRGLQLKAYGQFGHGADINACIFYIENNIPLEYSDYVSLLISLDHFNKIDILTDEETRRFALIIAKILQIKYHQSRNISINDECYYTNYLQVIIRDKINHNLVLELESAKISCNGFEDYISYLIFKLKVQRFWTLGLVRALQVFMRAQILVENEDYVVKLCNNLNDIFLKLAKHVINESPNFTV